MKHSLFRAVLLAAVLGGIGWTETAWAQIGSSLMPGGGPSMPSIDGAKRESGPRRPATPAMPGAQVDQDMVTPSNRPSSDMGPTEALFDAINRGDIASARDAVRRGANLRARSVLGMTPLELSVDLGRRDISFLLLSLRGSDDASAPVRERPAAITPSAAEQARAARLQAERAEAVRRAAARTPPPSGPATTQNPRLFAGDGGRPVPEAGFLGFGGAQNNAR